MAAPAIALGGLSLGLWELLGLAGAAYTGYEMADLMGFDATGSKGRKKKAAIQGLSQTAGRGGSGLAETMMQEELLSDVLGQRPSLMTAGGYLPKDALAAEEQMLLRDLVMPYSEQLKQINSGQSQAAEFDAIAARLGLV